jgi:hypothetical protein
MQGIPPISGTSGLAAVVVKPSGELGTRNGVQVVVKESLSSPDWHWATDVFEAGAEKIAIVGAVAAATMKLPDRISRRIAKEDVAIPRF